MIHFLNLRYKWGFGINRANFPLFHSSSTFDAWTIGLILHGKEPVVLDHKMWWIFQKQALSLRQKLLNIFWNFTCHYLNNTNIWTFTTKDNKQTAKLLWSKYLHMSLHIANNSFWKSTLWKQFKLIVLQSWIPWPLLVQLMSCITGRK